MSKHTIITAAETYLAASPATREWLEKAWPIASNINHKGCQERQTADKVAFKHMLYIAYEKNDASSQVALDYRRSSTNSADSTIDLLIAIAKHVNDSVSHHESNAISIKITDMDRESLTLKTKQSVDAFIAFCSSLTPELCKTLQEERKQELDTEEQEKKALDNSITRFNDSVIACTSTAGIAVASGLALMIYASLTMNLVTASIAAIGVLAALLVAGLMGAAASGCVALHTRDKHSALWKNEKRENELITTRCGASKIAPE